MPGILNVLLAAASDPTFLLAHGIDNASSTASATFVSNGDLTTVGVTTPPIDPKEWYRSNPLVGIGANYEIRATLLSGSGVVGVLDTWQALSIDRSWSNAPGTGVFSILIEIRRASDAVVVESAQFDIS